MTQISFKTMEEAWAESDRLEAESYRLWAESYRLEAESTSVVVLTAQALYGKDVQIDWSTRSILERET